LPAAPRVSASPPRARAADLAIRWIPLAGLVALGSIVLFPNWVLLPQDDEGLFLVVDPTRFQAEHFYAFWNPLIGFGMPQPGSESLTFHPFALAVRFLSLATSIGLLYQVQFWIALIAVWGLCRHLGMRRWITGVCAFTFAVSTVTIELLVNFWPDLMVAWTLSPLMLLVLLKLLESEGMLRRLLFSVATGVCAGFMIVDGHAGVVPTFGLAIAAFLIAEVQYVRRVWPWLGLAVVVAGAISASRVFDVSLENARSTTGHYQQVLPFDLAHFLFYPHDPAGAAGFRTVAFGLPFVLLTLVGLVWRPVARPFGWGLRAAVVVSFVGWFLPVSWLSVLSGNYHFGQPLTLFAIILAGITLQKLWERRPGLRPGLVALAVIQVALVGWGFYDGYYRSGFRDATHYLDGSGAKTLRNTFKNQPIYRYFEQRPDHASTRVLMSNGANPRLFRTLSDYQWSAWAWHGLRLVNTHVRGVDVSEFQKTKEALHGEIRGQVGLWEGPDNLERTNSVLDVLNIGYVLATPGERVARRLVPVKRFRLVTPAYALEKDQPKETTIVVYRNPTHWPDAVVVAPQARRLTTLSPREGCAIPGLLCDDLSPILALRRPGGVTAQNWHGTTLNVRLAASRAPRVLMVSQLYRPGWRAKLSNGRTIDGYRLFGGMTGFDLPARVRSAAITFQPTGRIVFAALSWAAILLSVGFLVVIAAVGWHSRKHSQERG
jgi:hypothetical protein